MAPAFRTIRHGTAPIAEDIPEDRYSWARCGTYRELVSPAAGVQCGSREELLRCDRVPARFRGGHGCGARRLSLGGQLRHPRQGGSRRRAYERVRIAKTGFLDEPAHLSGDRGATAQTLRQEALAWAGRGSHANPTLHFPQGP
jgi:hypothetical protein